MTSAHKHQMSRHDRTRRTSTSGGWGSRAEAPVAYHGQDWPASCRAGIGLRTQRLGGLRGPAILSHSRCARRLLPDVAPGRFARDPLIGRTVLPILHASRGGMHRRRTRFRAVVQFVRDFNGARCLCVPEHFDCQVSYRSERHVRLSKFVGFNTDESMEKMSGTFLYQYGEFRKVQGAPQHEFG